MNMYACSICFFGKPDDPMNISLRAAIICMLIFLVLVLGLLGTFFWGVQRRAKRIRHCEAGRPKQSQ